MTISADEKLAIHELLSRAAYAYDERKLDLLESCFTPDAEFGIQIAGGDSMGPFEGRDALMAVYRGALEQQTDVRRHVISNILFEHAIDGDDVQVISNLTLFATADGETKLLTTGVYRDTVRREGDTWCLYKRHLDLDGPY